MKKFLIIFALVAASSSLTVNAADSLDDVMPVRGFCIGSPGPRGLDRFIEFIDKDLAPRHINTLILRVDYGYQFQSHPELVEGNALSLADVKRLVADCRSNNIHLIPQINLLGHQGFEADIGILLRKYPEFDETPWVKNPEHYKWPNDDNLYCRSYCPLHPKVHDVVFACVDEICDAFESDAFHAGMDEVFYIGEDKCPRCGGKDKAKLFADEVTRIHDHLKEKNRALWMWGDRFIDGKVTGLGEWEASYNGTAPAVDLVPKDIMICDWHYDRPDLTAAYFALKGLNVVSCPWKFASVGAQQADDMINWRHRGPPEISGRLKGVVQTVWSGTGGFISRDVNSARDQTNAWNCLLAVVKEVDKARADQGSK